MAIGDAVAVQLGTATTSRQPSSGVEEQISNIVKPAVTGGNGVSVYDGSAESVIIEASVRTSRGFSTTTDLNQPAYNMALMITNSLYLRKDGTADRVYLGGVQTAT
jgi:hypothetical protein